MQTTTTTTPATAGQLRYVAALLGRKDWSTLPTTWTSRVAAIDTALRLTIDTPEEDRGAEVNLLLERPLTRAGASALIDTLTETPDRQQEGNLPGAEEVPAGTYALPTVGEADNGLAFYEVSRPEHGRWAGWVFISRHQGPEEVRVPRSQVASILERLVEVGPQEAMAAYGREVGRCGACGLRLTNDESRAYGIGPKCRTRF